MNQALRLCNRQRARSINLRLFRRITITLLRDLIRAADFELTVHLVAPSEITHLNETYLRHRGPTDVITFNYAEEEAPASGFSHGPPALESQLTHLTAVTWVTRADRRRTGPFSFHGEIFICLEEAHVQSRRYRTTWPAELVRYLVHGALHLCGYDDSKPAPRKRMKRAEDRLLREISRHYSLPQLAGPRRPH